MGRLAAALSVARWTWALGLMWGCANPSPAAPDTPAFDDARPDEVARALATPRPIPAHDSVWMAELTWMEVRDAIAAGRTTAIVPTGGMEDNGPFLATAKHDVIVAAACTRIAQQLGNALCAPVLSLVPQGNPASPTGHMRYPGTLSLREDTFVQVLLDIGESLHQHGFELIVFIGDSGGNQAGLEAAADQLNTRWSEPAALHVPEFYDYDELTDFLENELGIVEPQDDGLHDDYLVTTMMMAVDPHTVRHRERLGTGLASINGLSIEDADAAAAVGRRLLDHRADRTVAAIRRHIPTVAR